MVEGAVLPHAGPDHPEQLGPNGAKQHRQCREVWVASSCKRLASLAATKEDITLHQEQKNT